MGSELGMGNWWLAAIFTTESPRAAAVLVIVFSDTSVESATFLAASAKFPTTNFTRGAQALFKGCMCPTWGPGDKHQAFGYCGNP